MSEVPLASDDARDGEPAETDPGLVAHVESYEGAPDECTIYPAGLEDAALVTSWISAKEESYVALSAMR